MKRSHYIYLFICLIGVFGIYQYCRPAANSKSNYPVPPWGDDEDHVNSRRNRKSAAFTESPRSNDKSHLEVCRRAKKIRGAYLQFPSSNYYGLSLISNATDQKDLVLCPGDMFGDLNGTYITVEYCDLAMYREGNLIWSSNKLARLGDEKMLCAIALQRDGNLVVYKESMVCLYPIRQKAIIWPAWESKTNFQPNKTELRIQDQQLQLVHTLEDGSERVFYAGENIREFWEDLGAPQQVADKFLIKNHSDTDNVILRRNEYVGDLNGLYLILQSNCELQLKENKRTIWSFAVDLKPDENCTLGLQGSSIGLPKIPGSNYHYKGMNILLSNDFTVLQSNITLQGGRLMIIQTLNNGSKITFYSEPGQDNGLKLKRELRQIASNNITVSFQVTLHRMDYIGNLDGLHLVLQDNCHLKLNNGQQELWRLQENLNESFMECFVDFKRDGTITFQRLQNEKSDASVQIFGIESYKITRYPYPSQFRFFLENDTMTIILQYKNNHPSIYQATPNTNGTWFQVLSGNSSLIVNANDADDQIFPQMGYLGDINGVYAVLNKRSNWILFNKTKPIWESGTIHDDDSHFVFTLTKDGNVAIFNKMYAREEDHCLWSTQHVTAVNSKKEALLSSAELLVNNEGLWLIHNYTDGTVRKFKTNSFVLVPNESEFEVSSLSQIHKL